MTACRVTGRYVGPGACGCPLNDSESLVTILWWGLVEFTYCVWAVQVSLFLSLILESLHGYL